MRYFRIIMVISLTWGSQQFHAQGEEPAASNPLLRGMQPLMVCCTMHAPPSPQEWASLNSDGQHFSLWGGVGDFKSRTITFNNSRYYSLNATEGVLASYGKMGVDHRYDRFGQIEGVEFSIDQNSWKERYVMNAAALLKLTGSRFLEYAGVGLDAAVDKDHQIEVTFLGTNVPKDKVIRQLNGNIEALEYFDALQQKLANYDRDSLKFVKTPPPVAKVVLENVVMLTGNFSDTLNTDTDASLKSRVLEDGIELKLTTKSGGEMTLLSPVVRCYRTYSIDFKVDGNGNVIHEQRVDRDGSPHSIPQVFDLTPDI